MGFFTIGRDETGKIWERAGLGWEWSIPRHQVRPTDFWFQTQARLLYEAWQRKQYKETDALKASLTQHGVLVEQDRTTLRLKW